MTHSSHSVNDTTLVPPINPFDAPDVQTQCLRNASFDNSLTGSTAALHMPNVRDTCTTCGQCYPTNVMHKHIATCKGSHVCPYCSSTFSRPSYLKRHMNRMHSSFGRPICSVCLKSFSSTSALSTHQRLHRGEARYSCKFCGARFSQGCHLEFHLDSYHAHVELKDVSKPFNCEFCDRGFLFSISLLNHQKQHLHPKPKKLSCPECGHSFGFRSELERHYITHMKRPIFQCSFCPQAFSRLSRLNAHVRRHLAPDLFSCRHCLRTYASQAYLAQHLKTHGVNAKTPQILDRSSAALLDFTPESISDNFVTEPGQGDLFDEESFQWSCESVPSQCLSPEVSFLHAVLFDDVTNGHQV